MLKKIGFECGQCFVWYLLVPPLLAFERIEAHLKDYGVHNGHDLYGDVWVLCGHRFLIVFDMGDKIFEVSLSIDL